MDIKKRIFIPMILLTTICCAAVLISSVILYSRELDVSAENTEDVINIILFISSGTLITLLVIAGCIIFAQYLSRIIEERINRVNERALLMLNTSPLCTQIFNKELQTIDCNEEAVRLYGLKEKQDYIDGFIELCHPEYQPDGRRSDEKAKEMITKAFEEGKAVFLWTHQIPADHSPLPAEITLVRVRHKDDDVIVAYTRDLRELTKREEELTVMKEVAQSANRSKTIFLTNMSHEIRTPMNSILGFSELAQGDDIPEKTRTYLGYIKDSADWLLKIINDILDISKIESGKIELEHIPFELPEIFAHCQSSIMPKVNEKGIMLYCYAEPSIGKRLIGDPVRLRQVIMNLLSNAVKFTKSGTVKLLASLTDSDDTHANIQFEIKDSGIGMSREQIDRIFEPFKQADDSITRKFGGTGLGLTIIKNIIELMGGTLVVESAPGIGSRFSFEIAFELVDDVSESMSEKITVNDFERPNFKGDILVCEDNSLNQQVICDHLSRVGIRTVVAYNGKEGVNAVEERINSGKKPFDLIFMDIHMPIMDGLEAAEHIKQLGVETPIVALTANVMSNDLELYKASGMSDTVGKPFTANELWRCLITFLPVESYTAINQSRQAAEDSKSLKLMKTNFVTNNQTIFSEFTASINSDDLKTAHRIAHTIKSNAGQIGEKRLQSAAAVAEAMLAGGKNQLSDEHIKNLESELTLVLNELAPLLNEKMFTGKSDSLDIGKALELIEKLEPMLKNRDTKCVKLIEDVYAIPGMENLAKFIMGYKFKQALAEAESLKERLVSANG